MFFGNGNGNRNVWFLILIISLYILLFPDFFDTSDCS